MAYSDKVLGALLLALSFSIFTYYSIWVLFLVRRLRISPWAMTSLYNALLALHYNSRSWRTATRFGATFYVRSLQSQYQRCCWWQRYVLSGFLLGLL
jgi:hypothetical protein